MSLNLGRDFSLHWQAAPEQFRQEVFFELKGLTDLLASDSNLETWQAGHEAALAQLLQHYKSIASQPAVVPPTTVNIIVEKKHALSTPISSLPADQLIPEPYRIYIEQRLATLKTELENWVLEQLTAPNS